MKYKYLEADAEGVPKENKPLPTGVKNIEPKVITNPEEKKKCYSKTSCTQNEEETSKGGCQEYN